MSEALIGLLQAHGYDVFPRSIRQIGEGRVFVAHQAGTKLIGLVCTGNRVGLSACVFGPMMLPSGEIVSLHEATWENYEALRLLMPLGPVRCDRNASFGMGDRLGMVTAAHLDALTGHKGEAVILSGAKDLSASGEILRSAQDDTRQGQDDRRHDFPVIAQQSPRELLKTGRSFRGVLLDAVMGALEVGYTGTWGADADHIKEEAQLIEAVRAGYSMYTLDLSGWSGQCKPSDLSDPSDLSEQSRRIVQKCSGLRIGDREASEQEMIRSALTYQAAMENAVRFHAGIASSIPSFDLEISIDEGSKETTLEDHLFVAECLHGRGIDFTSLAPKFPGKFRKGIDFIGDLDALIASMEMHAALARTIGGYKLSLHSGSDKFSVYKPFTDITEGRFHVKTSGTSWLEAMTFISQTDKRLFREMYRIALDNLEESVKAYDTEININDFPPELPPDTYISRADANMRQLWHISYGILLAEKGDAIRAVLAEHEAKHYEWVRHHIGQHLECLAF